MDKVKAEIKEICDDYREQNALTESANWSARHAKQDDDSVGHRVMVLPVSPSLVAIAGTVGTQGLLPLRAHVAVEGKR